MHELVFADSLSGFQPVSTRHSADENLAIQIVKSLKEQRRGKDDLKRTFLAAGHGWIAAPRVKHRDRFSRCLGHATGKIKLDSFATSESYQSTIKEMVVIQQAHALNITGVDVCEIRPVQIRRQSERLFKDLRLPTGDLLGSPMLVQTKASQSLKIRFAHALILRNAWVASQAKIANPLRVYDLLASQALGTLRWPSTQSASGNFGR